MRELRNTERMFVGAGAHAPFLRQQKGAKDGPAHDVFDAPVR